jgi:group I intron endonuclease
MVIYKTTNIVNGKFYIGQDSKNNPSYLGSGVLLSKAIKKYGKENFIKEIIEVCSTKKELNEREKYWINRLESIDNSIGYNIAEGGMGGNTYNDEIKKRISDLMKKKVFSEETRKKMSLSRKNKSYHTKESKEKISKTHKGKKLSKEHIEKLREYGKQSSKSKEFLEQQGLIQNYWPKGTKHTDESKQKMSEYHKVNPVRYWLGKKRSSETIEKAKQTNKGFKHSEKTKLNMLGEGNPFYGKKHSEETRKRISESKKNQTPEHKLERYRKFFISRMGYEPTKEVLNNKLQEYRGEG